MKDNEELIIEVFREINDNYKITSDNITDIKQKIACLPCDVHQNKIGYLEKVVFGAVAIILIAFMGILIPKVIKDNDKKDLKKSEYTSTHKKETIKI